MNHPHYDNHQDLFSRPVTTDTMRGAVPAPNWLILEAIPKPDEHQSTGGIIMTNAATKASTPLVFRVIAVGEGVGYTRDDLVLVSFLAGDKLSSEIVVCHQDDIILKWGEGIRR
jgi:co-chaperonin GroES (HSP10)